MSQSHEMRVLLSDDILGATLPMAFAARNCDLLGTDRFGRDTGKRGTRQQYACGARKLGEDVAGGFDCYPTVTQLDWLLKRALGDNIATFPAAPAAPGETLPAVYAFVDKGPENYRYDLMRISRLTLSVREGDYLSARVDFVGSSETKAVTWPVGAPSPDCATEFAAHDVGFTVGAVEYPFKSMDVVVDNMIASGQQENALVRTIFESEDLAITLNGTFAYRDDTKALYRRGVTGDDGATLVIDNGTTAYTLTFGNIKIPSSGPTVPESGEITMQLAMNAFRTAAAQQISIAKV